MTDWPAYHAIKAIGLGGIVALVVACSATTVPADGGTGSGGSGGATDGGGGVSGTGGAADGGAGLRWYRTCGDPVCRTDDGGAPDGGPAACPNGIEGSACTDAGATCDPGIGCNVKLICADRNPIASVGGCPISRRAAKTGISYLDGEAIARLAAELQSLRLATYRYRADPKRERLGLILDDVPGSSVLAEPGDQVDLYGYLSMAVAGLQAQKKQLDAQGQELAALRSQVARLAKVRSRHDPALLRSTTRSHDADR